MPGLPASFIGGGLRRLHDRAFVVGDAPTLVDSKGLLAGYDRVRERAEKMKVLPHKGPRSRSRPKRSTGRSARYPKTCQVQAPKIFVEVSSNMWGGVRKAEAKIRVRRGCYRYLCWRDGLFKREFYLGKVKILTTHLSRGAAPGAAAAGGAAGDRAGVQN